MVETIGFASKAIYLCTIILALWSWMIASKLRESSATLKKVFVLVSTLVPLYAIFAILYVFDIAYEAWIGYIGWTVINTLFIFIILILLKDRNSSNAV